MNLAVVNEGGVICQGALRESTEAAEKDSTEENCYHEESLTIKSQV